MSKLLKLLRLESSREQALVEAPQMGLPPRYRELADLLKHGLRDAHEAVQGAKRAPCSSHLRPVLLQEG